MISVLNNFILTFDRRCEYDGLIKDLLRKFVLRGRNHSLVEIRTNLFGITDLSLSANYLSVLNKFIPTFDRRCEYVGLIQAWIDNAIFLLSSISLLLPTSLHFKV